MNERVDEANDMSRSLVKDASDLRRQIQRLTGAANVDQQIRIWNPIAESLGRASEGLDELKARLTDAANKGIQADLPACPVDPQEISELAANARTGALDEERCRSVVTEIGQVRVTLNEALELAWKGHCDRLLPGLDGYQGLTDALMEIEGFDGVTQARTKVTAAIGHRDGAFATDRADAFASLAESIPVEVDALLGGNEEVEQFLRTAVDTGVSLDDLDDSVLEWLNDKNLLGSFRVVTRSPQRR